VLLRKSDKDGVNSLSPPSLAGPTYPTG
jgi:hypothetical protein